MSAKNNIIMVTGVSPGIGKTFISSNLGGVLGEDGKTVVVVDADLRRGTIHQLFGVSRGVGLSELIMGTESIDAVLQITKVDNLSYITTGAVPKNPAELLLHVSFEEKLKFLSEKFDYVVIDSPPTLAASDAAVIGRYVGVTLFVIKSNTHSMNEIEQGVRKLTQAGININGFILNDVVNRKGSSNGHVYQYAYANVDEDE
jgi:tyrosine-protein kinase Etk/Wzc